MIKKLFKNSIKFAFSTQNKDYYSSKKKLQKKFQLKIIKKQNK